MSKTEGFCVENEEFCIYSDESCSSHDAFALALAQTWPEGESIMRQVAISIEIEN